MGAVSYEARTFENTALCYENQATPMRQRGARKYFGAFDVEANSEFYVSAKMRIAKIYFGTGKFELAIERAFALLKGFGSGETSLDCARINALCFIGDSFLAQRNFAEARRIFNAMLELTKTDRYFKTDEYKAAKFLKICDDGEHAL